MGSGLSHTEHEISNYIKQKYATDPKKTTKMVHECYRQVNTLNKKRAFKRPELHIVNTKFNEMDSNGNGLLSLAEIDKLISTMYPEFDNKPALIRAYHASDSNGDGLISKKEFRCLWKYIEYFNKLWHKFELIDKDGDRKLSVNEFQTMSQELFETEFGEKEAAYYFDLLDTNEGGAITFTEFCSFMIKRKIALE